MRIGIDDLRSDQVGLEEESLPGPHLRLHLGGKPGLPVESAQGVTDMRIDIVDLFPYLRPGGGIVLVDDFLE